MSEWKSIVIGFIVFGLMTVMYYAGRKDGYEKGYDAGYDRGYEYGHWLGRKCKDGDGE